MDEPDYNAQIAALYSVGAERFDPVRLHYIAALEKRAAAHQGHVKHLLEARLAQALSAFKERFEQAQAQAREIVAQITLDYPNAAKNLQQQFDSGDFKELKRSADSLKNTGSPTALGSLIQQLEQAPHPSSATGPAHAGVNSASRSELKTIRDFRNTWSKLSVEKQVAQALQQAPKNAGPINSHMLMLRSLTLMRDISPDYLNRFISYADTLLCLDQYDKGSVVNVKPAPALKRRRQQK